MSNRFRVLALLLTVSLLAGGCGGSEPATTRVPPMDTANLSPTGTPVPPTTTAVAPPSSAVPTNAPAARALTGPTPQRLQFSPQTWTMVSPAEASSTGRGDVARTVLTYGELMNGFPPNSPVDEDAFLMPEGAAPSEHTFEGTLELFGEATTGDIEILRGELAPEAAHLPEFDYAFVQSGSYLVPAKRGQIITDHPNWNVILEPARVWKENADQGHSRASFPFALVWKGSNATFNGTMTFLLDEMSVSRVWHQITQETTSYTRANFWGLLEAAYHPGPVSNATQIRLAFDQELADRFPTKTIDQLAQDYPGIDVSAFGRDVSPEHRTMYGFVINGVNYVGECRTRAGRYAYCDWMRATSHSTAPHRTLPLRCVVRHLPADQHHP